MLKAFLTFISLHTLAPGMQVIQSKPIMQYSQTNGTLMRKTGGKIIVQEADSGEDETIEETQTIIKKTIVRKKGKKTYVRFWKFLKLQVAFRKEDEKLYHCMPSLGPQQWLRLP
jgi:hypothetical protein